MNSTSYTSDFGPWGFGRLWSQDLPARPSAKRLLWHKERQPKQIICLILARAKIKFKWKKFCCFVFWKFLFFFLENFEQQKQYRLWTKRAAGVEIWIILMNVVCVFGRRSVYVDARGRCSDGWGLHASGFTHPHRVSEPLVAVPSHRSTKPRGRGILSPKQQVYTHPGCWLNQLPYWFALNKKGVIVGMIKGFNCVVLVTFNTDGDRWEGLHLPDTVIIHYRLVISAKLARIDSSQPCQPWSRTHRPFLCRNLPNRQMP